MRDARTLLTAIALGAALLVSALPAAAQTGRIGGTIKDDKGQPIKGATVARRESAGVAVVFHRHDGRQRPLLDHRAALGQLEDHGVGAGLRAGGGRRAASARSARRIRRSISCSSPGAPARPARWPGSTPRSCRSNWPRPRS